MNAIPAQVAKVERIVVVTPPRSLEENPLVAAALKLLDLNEVYRIGGAQSIGALAYGTPTVAKVEKIVGPGNAFVQAAKRQVYGTVDIDMDSDGTKNGYDLDLTRRVAEAVRIPVIASGGAGNLEHLYKGLTDGSASAVLAASIFHFRELTIGQAKSYLRERGVVVR